MHERGQMKFESILFFISTSPEAALPRQKQPQYRVVPWAGKIKNGLGLTAITWDAKISYSYHDGRIIGNPARQFSHHSKLPLWWVIAEQTGIELGQRIGPGTGVQPFGALPAFFRLAWSSGFQKPLKVNTRYLSAELPDLNTGVNRLERVYEIRGNGTYVQIYRDN
jgi:hypothetical protein